VHQTQLVLVFEGGDLFQVDDEGVAPVLGARGHLQHADGEAEGVVDGGHPARVAPGEVIVDRDQVGSLAGDGAQVERQRGDQGFALAGAHLAILPSDGHPADELTSQWRWPMVRRSLRTAAKASGGFHPGLIRCGRLPEGHAPRTGGLGAQGFIERLVLLPGR
jgi:hypothetical protein